MYFLRYNVSLFVAGVVCLRFYPNVIKALNLEIKGELLHL